MNEFVEECRREWRRLGVPDPIANEMAMDLTADIEEAEAEGGSAEDVLGNSVFDARRFAASWAGARGVTALAPAGTAPAPLVSATDPEPPPRRQPVLAIVLTAIAAVIAVSAAALLVGRHSASAAAFPVRRFFGPASGGIVVPRPPIPPFRVFVTGVGHGPGELVALVVVVLATLGFTLALVYWSPWSGRGSRRPPG